jgi:DNA replication and repair protein RecF
MKLTHIRLRNFRSYVDEEIDFSDGINLIRGVNGSGKTNLVEAVYYLSLAKSWRTSDNRSLIHSGADSAYIAADVAEGGVARHIEIFLTVDGRKILVNGKSIHRLSELSKLVNVVLFSPEDVSLFSGSPGERRAFLDVNLSKQSLDYFSLIGKHNRLLEERNAVLKGNKIDSTYLDVVTSRLIEVGEPLERYRRVYVGELNKVLSELASALYGQKRSVVMVFHPFVKGDAYPEEAKKAFQRSQAYDILHKATSVGLQREDFSLLLDNKDIALYGSQGENRLAAIALKLAPYFLIEDEEKKPIAVLDDVYSELDEAHARSLTELLKKLKQSFVTAASIDITGASLIEVADHKATRRI